MKKAVIIIFCLVNILFAQQVSPVDLRLISFYEQLERNDTSGFTAFHDSLQPLLKKSASDYTRFLYLRSQALFSVRKKNFVELYERLDTMTSFNGRSAADTLKGLAWHYRAEILFSNTSDLSGALQALNEAEKYFTKYNQKIRLVRNYYMKGTVNTAMKIEDEAIKNYYKCLEILKEVPNEGYESNIYNVLGLHYGEKGDSAAALNYHRKALSLRMKANNPYRMGQSYNNIGTAYFNSNDFVNALKYYEQGLKFRKEVKPAPVPGGVIESEINIGKTFYKLGKYKDAEQLLLDALDKSEALGALELKRRVSEILKELYFEKGKYKEAYRFQAMYFLLKDSLYALSKRDEINEINVRTELASKHLNDSLRREQQFEIKTIKYNEKIKAQQIYIWLAAAGFIMLGLILYILWRGNRNKKRANEIITHQKEEVEKQKKLVEQRNIEITDSINYAKGLLDHIIPAESEVKKYFSDAFVLFMPKDIVAGDFYWLESVNEDLTLFAAADCTGHGVPGALMSLVAINSLNSAVKEYNLKMPDEILNFSREVIIQQLNKEGSEGRSKASVVVDAAIKDGMDIALIAYSKSKSEVYYSGAYNSLWIIKSSGELIEAAADKMPVGKSYYEQVPFTLKTINVEKGDKLYLFSDGYADQFGGPKRKKFKQQQLKDVVMKSAKLSANAQKIFLKDEFLEWKGSQEQIDDVCIAAIVI